MAAGLRRDRRSQAEDTWGVPGKSYPYGDTAYPQIIETETARQNYTQPAFGSAHPNSAYTNLILTDVKTSPGDNTDANWWLKYETIPGPTINSTRIDFDGKTVNIAAARKLASAITSGETKTLTVYTKTTKQGGESPDFIATEVVETRPIGGNARPTTAWQFGIAVETTAQLLAVEDLVGDFSDVVGNTFVRKYKQPYNESAIVGMQFVETWPLNGPSVPEVEKKDGILVTTTTQLVKVVDVVLDAGSMDGSNTHWIVKTRRQFEWSEDVCYQVTESWPIAGPLVPDTDWRSGVQVTSTVQLLKASNVVTTQAIDGSDWVVKRKKSFDSATAVAFQIIETWALPGKVLTKEERRAQARVTTTTQVKATGLGVAESGGVKSWYVPFGDSDDVFTQFIETWELPSNLQDAKDLAGDDADVITAYKQLKLAADIDANVGESVDSMANTRTQITKVPFEDYVSFAWEVTIVRTAAGEEISTQEPDRDGVKKTITRQQDITTDIEADVGESMVGATHTRVSLQPIPKSKLTANRVTETRAFPGPELTNTRQGGTNYPAEFMSSVDVTQDSVIGADATFVEANPNTGLIASSLEQVSIAQYNSTQTNANFTGLSITEQRTDPVHAIAVLTTKKMTPSLGGVSGVTVTNAGTGYTTATATSPAPSGGIAARYRVNLSGGHIASIDVIDPGSGHLTAPTITIAGNGTSGAATASIPAITPVSAGSYFDIDPLNKWKSIQIASKIDTSTLPSELILPKMQRLSLPDLLVAISGQWSVEKGVSQTESTSPAGLSGTAHCTVDGGVNISILGGFRGDAKGRFHRKFFSSLPSQSDLPTPTTIKPSTGTCVINSKGNSLSASYTQFSAGGSYSGMIRAHSISFGPVLTNGVTPTSTSTSDSQNAADSTSGPDLVASYNITANCSATMTVTAPISTPTAFSSGDLIVLDGEVTPWRFGIYVLEYNDAYVP